jgi:hypothetical protein
MLNTPDAAWRGSDATALAKSNEVSSNQLSKAVTLAVLVIITGRFAPNYRNCFASADNDFTFTPRFSIGNLKPGL